MAVLQQKPVILLYAHLTAVSCWADTLVHLLPLLQTDGWSNWISMEMKNGANHIRVFQQHGNLTISIHSLNAVMVIFLLPAQWEQDWIQICTHGCSGLIPQGIRYSLQHVPIQRVLSNLPFRQIMAIIYMVRISILIITIHGYMNWMLQLQHS